MLDGVNTGSAADSPRNDVGVEKSEEQRATWRKSGRLWPLGVAATGVAGMFLLALRGCWHRRMSWPVRAQGHSYQVCLGCGVKRLFDDEQFCSYGPFRYDLKELIAWSNEHKKQELVRDLRTRRPAS
jgi:hypothetical protein